MNLSRRSLLSVTGLSLALVLNPFKGVAATRRVMSSGIDISWLPDVEAAGGLFYTNTGQKIDAIKLMKLNGVRVGRIRVFVNPTTPNGNLARALALAKRLKSQRMEICIDLHYSDVWADPGNQSAPVGWPSEITELEKTLATYTEETLLKFVDAGLAPKWVQIGNEIGGGFLWPLGRVTNGTDIQWQNFVRLHNTATAALRRVVPGARSVVHLEWGGDPDRVRWWLAKAQTHGLVRYDAIGLSYYSQWSGSLSNLEKTLNVVSTEFKSPVVIAETAYPWIAQNFGNDVLDISSARLPGFAYSAEGQKEYVMAVKEILLRQPANRGIGLWWWEGLAVVVRAQDGTILWNGGMANSALINRKGRALPALKAMGE